MPARTLRISMDTDLLERIDADPEVREKGRSAFIRAAVRIYLEAKERRGIDARPVEAYGGEADPLLAEVDELLGESSRI